MSLGRKYDPHYDYFSDKVNIARGGHRIAAVLMYLTNVTKGGETVLPQEEEPSRRRKPAKDDDLSECAKKGIAVKPRRGDALLFFSLFPTAIPDPSSPHAGCPVIEGDKWSATKWIHADSFSKNLDVGGNCTDLNESCERWAALGECTKNREYMIGTAELPGYCKRSCNGLMGFAKPWRPRAADSIATHWVLHPIADSININNQVWEMYFRNLIPRLVKKGDDGNC